MPAPVVNSDLIQISAYLRELPFNPVITCDSKSVTVTLRPHVGQPVTVPADIWHKANGRSLLAGVGGD